MAKGDGVELDVSFKDQLALGRVLHRYLVHTTGYRRHDGNWLTLDGVVSIARDDELEAIDRALKTAEES